MKRLVKQPKNLSGKRLTHQSPSTKMLGTSIANWTTRPLPQRKEMVGQYCLLEPLDVTKHAQELFEEFQRDVEGDDWTYLPFGPFFTYSNFLNWLEPESQKKIFFTICDPITQVPRGIASYHDIDQEHGVIEIGCIILGRSIQKTTTATEAMYLMMKHVFDELNYRRYQWRCNSLNQASRRAATRLGFQFEGIFRNAHVFKGRNRDTAWYSITDAEWPKIKSQLESWLHESNFDDNRQQLRRLHDFKEIYLPSPL